MDINEKLKNLIGKPQIIDIPTKELFDVLSSKVLFDARWGFSKGNLSDEEYKSIIENKAKPALEMLKKQEETSPVIEFKAVYCFFACKSEGNKITVLDSNNKEIVFDFPRQEQPPNLCITDYVDNENSIIPFFAVTLGSKIIEAEKRLFEENSYYNYHLLHGLGAEMADCGAQCTHKIIRDEYFQIFPDKEKTKGCRYSFGYPSCPELADQRKLFELLNPSKIGLTLTASYQMVPELSVSGFIIFNKEAKFFVP
jgi:5-methyltetrahydrofolate--homocysteine methyltransferase